MGPRISNKKPPAYVRFSSVEVREYALTVGDCGLTKDTCPLSLSWEFLSVAPKHLKAYETSRTLRHEHLKELRPLNLLERRRRIADVQGIPFSMVRALEKDRMFDAYEDLMESIEQTAQKCRMGHDPELDDLLQELLEAVEEWNRLKSSEPSLDEESEAENGDGDSTLIPVSVSSRGNISTFDLDDAALLGDVELLLNDMMQKYQAFDSSASSIEHMMAMERGEVFEETEEEEEMEPAVEEMTMLQKMSAEVDKMRWEEGRHPQKLFGRRESFYRENTSSRSLPSERSCQSDAGPMRCPPSKQAGFLATTPKKKTKKNPKAVVEVPNQEKVSFGAVDNNKTFNNNNNPRETSLLSMLAQGQGPSNELQSPMVSGGVEIPAAASKWSKWGMGGLKSITLQGFKKNHDHMPSSIVHRHSNFRTVAVGSM